MKLGNCVFDDRLRWLSADAKLDITGEVVLKLITEEKERQLITRMARKSKAS